jgi:hypothetical protein
VHKAILQCYRYVGLTRIQGLANYLWAREKYSSIISPTDKKRIRMILLYLMLYLELA